eukprot:1921755-Lingulodinium_polyedra.AAC.1
MNHTLEGMEEGNPIEPAPTDYVAVLDSLPSGGGPPDDDHWIQLPGYWARMHIQPRRASFIPDGVD